MLSKIIGIIRMQNMTKYALTETRLKFTDFGKIGLKKKTMIKENLI